MSVPSCPWPSVRLDSRRAGGRGPGGPGAAWADPVATTAAPKKKKKEKDPTCCNRKCAACCALSRDGACARCLAAAEAAEQQCAAELPRVWRAVGVALDAAADAAGAPRETVRRAFAVPAVRYRAPQRAITCALHGHVRQALAARATPRERYVLDSCADRAASAVWLAAPVGRHSMPDKVARLALRRRVGFGILAPGSLLCATVSGDPPRVGCAAGGPTVRGDALPADAHALICKCGGRAILVHNAMRSCFAAFGRECGIPLREETSAHLPRERNLIMDVFCECAGARFCAFAVDFCGAYGASAAALAAREAAKHLKYQPAYQVPVCVKGFAFNDLCAFGPGAHECVGWLAEQAARAGAGHPEDLAAELYSLLGLAHARAVTGSFAWFAHVNNDTSPAAPRWPLDPTVHGGPLGPRRRPYGESCAGRSRRPVFLSPPAAPLPPAAGVGPGAVPAGVAGLSASPPLSGGGDADVLALAVALALSISADRVSAMRPPVALVPLSVLGPAASAAPPAARERGTPSSPHGIPPPPSPAVP